MMKLPTFAFLVCAAAFSPRALADSSTDFLPPAPAAKEWKLVWHDEFDGAKLDESKWNRLGDSKRRDGFWIKDDALLNGKGQLILRTRKDGERFTCGAVNTQGKFEHAFGYYAARCKMPTQPGHWPAFWLMSKGVNQVGDDGRDGTEIDIIEIPWRDGRLTSNLHWDGYGKAHKSAGTKFSVPAVTNGFHTFSLLWQPAEYVFYVDGKEVWRSAAGGVSQAPEFIKLTEEIGKWAGKIQDAQLPDAFEVDYVRVYDLVDRVALRVRSEITSDFAGDCLARWLGASEGVYPQRYSTERATTPASQTVPAHRGGAAPGHLLRCSSVTDPGYAPSSRLASGPATLPPKPEVIFDRTLRKAQ